MPSVGHGIALRKIDTRSGPYANLAVAARLLYWKIQDVEIPMSPGSSMALMRNTFSNV